MTRLSNRRPLSRSVLILAVAVPPAIVDPDQAAAAVTEPCTDPAALDGEIATEGTEPAPTKPEPRAPRPVPVVPTPIAPSPVAPSPIAPAPVVPTAPLAPSPVSMAGKVATASRLRGGLAIDGALDETAWTAAPAHGDFWQRQPDEGQAPHERTEFRLLYDDRALYIGVRAYDAEPALIRGLLTRRDVDSSSDWISVEIDSYHDRRTSFEFSVNAAGIQRDVLHFNDVEVDPGWDAVWESSARTDGQGWTAELRIPYSQLRFPAAPEQSWGLQIRRRVQRSQEVSTWSPWPRTASQVVSLYGTLNGIRDIGGARRFELLPYAVVGASLYDTDAGDSLRDGHDAVTGLGLDAKVGLGSNFTLSGTVNPDFGQVESDPSLVNLSAQETFLSEKRPFFIEGADIFRFSLGQGSNLSETLFYTRRIGAAPHEDALDHGDHADQPDATTIYGAAKISGKTPSGWSIGLLDAVTGQEDARVADDGEEGHRRIVVEPLTNYAVARVRKDLREGRTSVGAALTSVHRSLDGTGLDWLHDQAYTAGVEANHRFWDDQFTGDLRVIGSYVHGSPEAIDETQTSSVHYFQRPDAEHLDYDPTRTSLTGGEVLWSVGKSAGGHWRYRLGGDLRTPGFEVNDLGYEKNADYYYQWGWLQVREDQTGEFLRDHGLTLNAWRTWNTSSEHLYSGAELSGWFNLLSYWGAEAGAGVNLAGQDPYGLRGGPLLRRNPAVFAWLNGWSDSRGPVSAQLAANGSRRSNGSVGGSVTPLVTVQARRDLDLSIGPTFSAQMIDDQYVDQLEDAEGELHYLTARIRQVTTALTLRASYTHSAAFSLALYAQPFLSAGRYTAYKEVVAPLADRYDDRFDPVEAGEIMDIGDDNRSVDQDGDGAADYTFEIPDFNLRELKTNLVMRWDYRPGSAFFLIWSHGRTSETTDGRYDLTGDLADLAGEAGEHRVMAKLNYWLGL